MSGVVPHHGGGTPTIRVRNRQRRIAVDCSSLQRFAEHALPLALAEARRRPSAMNELEEVTVLLISDRRMAGLHFRFMKISGATDVLTFQHGEIFISAETAALNAPRFRLTTQREIELYLVHGLLHLAGLDDVSQKQARLMRQKQIGIARRARQSSAAAG